LLDGTLWERGPAAPHIWAIPFIAEEGERMPLNEEYAKQYWQLGNLITGFAVLQVLATLLSFASSQPFRDVLGKFSYIGLTLIVIAFHSLYGAATWLCYHMETRLLPPSAGQIVSDQRYILIGRLVAISLFGILLLCVLLPWIVHQQS
jgi:hypothetical protein